MRRNDDNRYCVRGDGQLLVYAKDDNHPLGDDYGDEGYDELKGWFDLRKPLSAPENDAACAAVLKLL